jgi:hypothetical protein
MLGTLWKGKEAGNVAYKYNGKLTPSALRRLVLRAKPEGSNPLKANSTIFEREKN